MHQEKTVIGLVQINNTFENSCYLPYTLGLLQTYCEQCGKGADRFVFLDYIYRRLPVAEAVERLVGVDIAAFSVFVWNYRLSLEIARNLKQREPDVAIVFGGQQVPFDARGFLAEHPYIDVVCHGEGEQTFLDLLENPERKDWKRIPSISYLENGEVFRNPLRRRIADLERIPSPYLTGIFDHLMAERHDFQWLGLLETNRGCPFSCSYCDWGSATQSRLYRFPTERVKREIDWFARNRIEFIFCCDSNFGILKRDLELSRYVAKIKEMYGYPKAFSVQNAKNVTERSYQIQKTLAMANLNKGVTLALQTVDDTTLLNIGRKNISLQSFEELQRRFNQDQVETYTDLILALPGETYDSFVDGVARVIGSGQNNRIQFINLSILPNAPMGQKSYQEQHGLRIIQSPVVNHHGNLSGLDESIQEKQDLVISTSTMPVMDWMRVRSFSWICSLIYFDKLLQIPILLLHKLAGCGLRDLIEGFCVDNPEEFPIFSDINRFFQSEAQGILSGHPEYKLAPGWLNIFWPLDEYVFIHLCTNGDRLSEFYDESRDILRRIAVNNDQAVLDFLDDSILLNHAMINQPKKNGPDSIELDWPIWDWYQAALKMEEISVLPKKTIYQIQRPPDKELEDWLRQVVWFGNKKGAYLNPVSRIKMNEKDSV